MTRVLVQRGAAGSSSNANRPPSTSAAQSVAATQAVAAASQAASTSRDEEPDKDRDFNQEPQSLGEVVVNSGSSGDKSDEGMNERSQGVSAASQLDGSMDKQESVVDETVDHGAVNRELGGLRVSERSERDGLAGSGGIVPLPIVTGCSFPPPPPVPPPKPSNSSMNLRRTGLGSTNALRIGPSRRPASRSVVSVRSPPSGSRPSSPRSYGEGEGYNSADEQSHCYVSSYDDAERERLFELDIRRTKGFEVKRMVEDGNCLFRAVADQVYGDPEAYDMVRQMCIDYMERERDHFSQFITEGFMSYCKRKRRDKVYGNNVEIQAFAEMYNRPIHIYSYSTEPINIFQGSYNTDTPPIRLSYHQRNHYNSLVDPRRLTIGAGLGFSSLQGTSIDKDRVKAVIKAQQDQQIDNALIAEGRFYSDLELTEKEIERMVMEASRAEYLAEDKLKQQGGFRESCTSGAEPSSSGARSSPSIVESGRVKASQHDMVLSKSMQIVLSMGFSYLQVIEAYSIFGDDVDSMVCYLLEMGGSGASPGGSSRQKGKAAE